MKIYSEDKNLERNIIIFGAGASFGSDSSGTPPLGIDLFDALYKFNPDGWGKIDDKFSKTFHEDFEEGVLSYSERYPHSLPPLQRAMAAFFFNFEPGPKNLYIELADKIKQIEWKGALVSLNYERLLELSLISSGIRPIIGKKAEIDNEIELCLPHGCCHLFCESVRATAREVSFSGQNVSTSGKIKVIDSTNDFNARISNDAFPPVMSYFDHAKRTTSGANFIEGQRKRYSELVIGASKIGIVGLKVRPHDTHIWNFLSKTDAKIIYCSGNSSGKEFKNWADETRSKKENIILHKYFSDAIDNLCNLLEIE